MPKSLYMEPLPAGGMPRQVTPATELRFFVAAPTFGRSTDTPKCDGPVGGARWKASHPGAYSGILERDTEATQIPDSWLPTGRVPSDGQTAQWRATSLVRSHEGPGTSKVETAKPWGGREQGPARARLQAPLHFYKDSHNAQVNYGSRCRHQVRSACSLRPRVAAQWLQEHEGSTEIHRRPQATRPRRDGRPDRQAPASSLPLGGLRGGDFPLQSATRRDHVYYHNPER